MNPRNQPPIQKRDVLSEDNPFTVLKHRLHAAARNEILVAEVDPPFSVEQIQFILGAKAQLLYKLLEQRRIDIQEQRTHHLRLLGYPP
ncbi:hypothetical protein D3C73_1450460 [compost metagenome]